MGNDVYQRLVDRLRHAEQYAEAARGMAEEARSLFGTGDDDVVAMTATTLDERVLDQLRYAEQYAEAAKLAVEEALVVLEEARKDGDDA
jgi:hypothetical protein